ncbi:MULTISPECIES: AbiV family abortive infection protein [unclassified Micromonospora]|uniref:AbiV family abortive infection protein n=1 Tax=unclassified Micromonospora TaxID=2617518 RepID=UPI00331DD017
MTTTTSQDARTFWKALMDNASSLIADADLLLSAGSFGRARALTVLAQEELGKAVWVYDTFSSAWSTGDSEPRKVDRLARHGRDHVQKFLEAFVYGDELPAFWGDYEAMDTRRQGESWEDAWQRRQREAEAAAKEANTAKQRGFYVDRDKVGTISSPTCFGAGTVADDLAVAAQVVEMLLIRDHSRMKMEAVTEYDSTHDQQFRLLPISHPEDWSQSSEEFRRGGIGATEHETEG